MLVSKVQGLYNLGHGSKESHLAEGFKVLFDYLTGFKPHQNPNLDYFGA